MITNFRFDDKEIKKGLYIVPTPIGNLLDITLRSIQILKISDFILCEDTRVSKNLLKKYPFVRLLIKWSSNDVK